MILYKYLTPERLDVLKTSTIRFSSLYALNDPFELRPHFHSIADNDTLINDLDNYFPAIVGRNYDQASHETDIAAYVTKTIQIHKEMIDAMSSHAESFLPKAREMFYNHISEKYGILCLSSVYDSLLMWAHYADSHQGFVVGFDSDSPFFTEQAVADGTGRPLEVIYSSTRPTLSMDEIKDLSIFTTKGRVWDYEKEWRMIMPLDRANKIIGTGQSAVHLFSFPKSSVHSIIIGSRTQKEIKSEVIRTVTDDKHYGHVMTIQASIDEKSYRLNFNPLN